MQKLHQRYYILTRYKLGLNAAAISNELDAAWGQDAPSYSTVQRWVKYFREGGESLEDDHRIVNC